MAWDEDVEQSSEDDILPAVVVTSDANQDSILVHVSLTLMHADAGSYLLHILNHQSQVADHCQALMTTHYSTSQYEVVRGIPSTITIKFRNPRKLGVTSAS